MLERQKILIELELLMLSFHFYKILIVQVLKGADLITRMNFCVAEFS